MSFIFKDKDFLKLIHKMAVGEAPAMTTTLFNKIFDNLKQVSFPGESSLLSGDKGFESATVPSLSSLAGCLEHIKLYKGKYSNQEIVPSDESIKSIQQDASVSRLYKPYQSYLVYADGLKVYLEFLFTSPDYKSKALYRELLGNLIDEANKALGLGIKLPDDKDEVIWRFNEETINISESLQYNSGPKALRVSDLDKISDWLSGMSLIDPEKTADASVVCRFLHYLYRQSQISKFKSQILEAGKKNNCWWAKQPLTTPTAPTTGDKREAPAVATGRPEKSETKSASELKTIIMSDFAPFYSHDAIIFRQGKRGILPFLELTIAFANENQIPDLATSASILKSNFEAIQNFLGKDEISVFTRASKPTAVFMQLSYVRKDLRSGFMSQKENQFKQCLDLLLNDIVNRLMDSLRIPRNIFTRLEYIEMSHLGIVSSAFISILAAANEQFKT